MIRYLQNVNGSGCAYYFSTTAFDFFEQFSATVLLVLVISGLKGENSHLTYFCIKLR